MTIELLTKVLLRLLMLFFNLLIQDSQVCSFYFNFNEPENVRNIFDAAKP